MPQGSGRKQGYLRATTGLQGSGRPPPGAAPRAVGINLTLTCSPSAPPPQSFSRALAGVKGSLGRRGETKNPARDSQQKGLWKTIPALEACRRPGRRASSQGEGTTHLAMRPGRNASVFPGGSTPPPGGQVFLAPHDARRRLAPSLPLPSPFQFPPSPSHLCPPFSPSPSRAQLDPLTRT